MVDAPPRVSGGAPQEFASYPRPALHPPLADRLEELVRAYYGISVAFLTTFVFASLIIGLIGLRSYRTSDVIHDGYIDIILQIALCFVPVLAGWLTYYPIRRLVRVAGWSRWAAVVLPLAVALYLPVSAFVFTSLAGPSLDGLSAVIAVILAAMSAFPLVRLLIVWQVRLLGVTTSGPWLMRKKMDAEINRLRFAAEPEHRQVTATDFSTPCA